MKRLGWLLLLPLAGIAGHYALRWVTTQLAHIGEDSTPPDDREGQLTMATPKLDTIAAHGNRGHQFIENNKITCADGYTLSVIAGGGTYCSPRPTMCLCDIGLGAYPGMSHEVAHDYPGPYSQVEVLVGGTDEPVSMPVDDVRTLIESHGGER